MSGRFDIVTVAFAGDLELLKLQARSFRLFFAPTSLARILILENDREPDVFLDRFQREVLPEYGDLQDRVTVIPKKTLLPDDYRATGWRTQQALKLLVEKHISTDAFLVLDAKNHFIRAADFATFASGEKFRSTFRAVSSMSDYLVRSLEYFGLDARESAKVTMPTTTPYVLNTSIVRYLIRYVEFRERCGFAEFFLGRNRFVTEFFLYFGFMLRFGIEPGALYEFGDPRSAALFTRAPVSPAAVTRVIQSLNDEWVVMFGLHRNRIGRFTESDKNLLVRVWREGGLFATDREAHSFLDGPAVSR